MREKHRNDQTLRTQMGVLGKKGSAVRWYPHLARRGEWASENELRHLIQGLKVDEYEVKKRDWGLQFPKAALFVDLYGKTFQEIRDGHRRGVVPVDEATLRDAIQHMTQMEYMKERKKLGPMFLEVGRFQKVYGKTFKEIRDGNRDSRWEKRWASKCVSP
jgi:hypothetical protein